MWTDGAPSSTRTSTATRTGTATTSASPRVCRTFQSCPCRTRSPFSKVRALAQGVVSAGRFVFAEIVQCWCSTSARPNFACAHAIQSRRVRTVNGTCCGFSLQGTPGTLARRGTQGLELILSLQAQKASTSRCATTRRSTRTACSTRTTTETRTIATTSTKSSGGACAWVGVRVCDFWVHGCVRRGGWQKSRCAWRSGGSVRNCLVTSSNFEVFHEVFRGWLCSV